MQKLIQAMFCTPLHTKGAQKLVWAEFSTNKVYATIPTDLRIIPQKAKKEPLLSQKGTRSWTKSLHRYLPESVDMGFWVGHQKGD